MDRDGFWAAAGESGTSGKKSLKRTLQDPVKLLNGSRVIYMIDSLCWVLYNGSFTKPRLARVVNGGRLASESLKMSA